MTQRLVWRGPLLALCLLPLAIGLVGAQEPVPAQRIACAAEPSSGPCRVDLATYLGYRVFSEFCSRCHAPDALGSSFAPNLLERIGAMDEQRFVSLMDDGYAGPRSTMRPWGEQPYVRRYYRELWTYLSARARGALPAGAPELDERAVPVSP